MESMEDKIRRLVEFASQTKLQKYTDLLRKKLVEEGVEPALIDNAAQVTTLELQVQGVDQSILEQTLRYEENRGIDTVGRILVEYCFIKPPTGRMIWPEYSDQDTLARWEFSEEVLPRPLMRYFLVSVRGTIEAIDGYSSESMLFEDTPNRLESIHQTIGELIEDFKGPFGSGDSAIDWQEVYEDAHFQKLALDLITNLRTMLSERGKEAYLSRLESYRQQDPNNTGSNLMQRPFSTEDVQQIAVALEKAETTLKGMP